MAVCKEAQALKRDEESSVTVASLDLDPHLTGKPAHEYPKFDFIELEIPQFGDEVGEPIL